mmetsp:Transcript_17226/g.44195  ORF Transcript_17226/g.44195 Transcript_17226/m.44195 type:complete len:283 (+) Transcript_17226:854-1702(+)
MIMSMPLCAQRKVAVVAPPTTVRCVCLCNRSIPALYRGSMPLYIPISILEGPSAQRSHGKFHDSTDDIAICLLERIHRLAAADTRLRHHELNVLGLHASLIHVTIIFGSRGRGLLGLNGLRLRHLELLSCRGLSLGAEVLDLSLTKDDIGVARRALEHIRVGDHEEDVFALLNSHTHDTRQGLHAKLLDGLAALLLRAALLAARASILALKLGHVVIGGDVRFLILIPLNLLNLLNLLSLNLSHCGVRGESAVGDSDVGESAARRLVQRGLANWIREHTKAG